MTWVTLWWECCFAALGLGTAAAIGALAAPSNQRVSQVMELGLPTLKVGAIAEWRVHSILRLGVGGDLGYVVVDRATTDRSMSALGIGVFGLGTVDLYSFGPRGDHAVYLGARFHAAAHFGATEWGPSAAVGFRY